MANFFNLTPKAQIIKAKANIHTHTHTHIHTNGTTLNFLKILPSKENNQVNKKAAY